MGGLSPTLNIMLAVCIFIIQKGKGHPITDHQGPSGGVEV
jgi:hypothetical protein